MSRLLLKFTDVVDEAKVLEPIIETVKPTGNDLVDRWWLYVNADNLPSEDNHKTYAQ